MKRIIAFLFTLAAFTWPVQAAVVQITVKDAGGTNRSVNVTTTTDITGNLSWNNVICDQATGATCASVGTAGSPSTNALTVQLVTLGNGTSANAARVTLSSDSTGVIGATQSGTWNIGTVATITNPVTANTQTADGADVTQGAKADAAWVSGSGSVIALLKAQATSAATTATNTGAPLPAGDNTAGRFTPAIPNGATQLVASATGTTAATSATLTSGVGVTAYLCGFSIRANATAAATGNATETGTGTTLNFTQWTAPLASGLGVTEMIFTPCLAASATNTNHVVTSAAPGSGGVVSVTAWGYSK